MRAAMRIFSVVAALLVPALAMAVGAAKAASATRIGVSVTPSTLRLAEGGRAQVRVATAGEAPVVAASAGRIEGLRQVAPGVYEADYVPPDTLDPQVALVTAASPSGFGWVAVRLAGVREVVVSAPRGDLVSVGVGDELFGPVPATSAGRAVVRVNVPPGVHFGRYRQQRIELDVPRKDLAHVFLDRTELDANARGAVTVRGVVVDEVGTPRRGARPKLVASQGQLSPPVEVEPGVFEARWTLQPSRVGDATVAMKVDARATSAIAALGRVPGPPSRVDVRGDPERFVAGEQDELTVTGRVLDAAGNPTDAPARLVVSLGSGDAARVLPDAVIEWHGRGGVYTGRVQVPRSWSGRQALELKVIATGLTTLVGTGTVALLPGAPDQVRVEPDHELRADGRSREVRVTVLDHHGNRVDGAGAPVITAARGEVGPPARERAGVYRLSYRSPLSADDFSDVISTRIGAVEGRTELRVRAEGGAVVVGPKAGFTMGSGELRSPDVGAEIGFWTRSLGMSLGLVLEGHYFTFARTDRAQAGDALLEVRSRGTFLAVEASAAWRRPLLSGMLWVGAGGGAVSASTTAETTGQGKVSARSWIPSAHASVGWGHPVGPGIPFGEVKLTAQRAPESGPLAGSLTSFTFALGYRFDVL